MIFNNEIVSGVDYGVMRVIKEKNVFFLIRIFFSFDGFSDEMRDGNFSVSRKNINANVCAYASTICNAKNFFGKKISVYGFRGIWIFFFFFSTRSKYAPLIYILNYARFERNCCFEIPIRTGEWNEIGKKFEICGFIFEESPEFMDRQHSTRVIIRFCNSNVTFAFHFNRNNCFT